MGRIALITISTIIATIVIIVVNLLTSGGAWWLWPALVALVIAAIVTEVLRDRRSAEPGGASQEISASGGALVDGSPQRAEGAGAMVSQRITARREGKVRNSSQTYRAEDDS